MCFLPHNLSEHTSLLGFSSCIRDEEFARNLLVYLSIETLSIEEYLQTCHTIGPLYEIRNTEKSHMTETDNYIEWKLFRVEKLYVKKREEVHNYMTVIK